MEWKLCFENNNDNYNDSKNVYNDNDIGSGGYGPQMICAHGAVQSVMKALKESSFFQFSIHKTKKENI